MDPIFRYKYKASTAILFLLLIVATYPSKAQPVSSQKWPVKKAQQWSQDHAWIIGCNYIPRTAINPIEMWQEASFDPKTIDQELGWAQDIGFNTVRVFLHYLVWARSPGDYKKRINTFLQIADSHHIKTMFVMWDDVWGKNPDLGPQPKPVPGIHNSGWVQNPGLSQRTDKALYPVFKAYIQDIIAAYADDNRVLMWDLYNEPGNGKHPPSSSMALLRRTMKWARQVNPTQPLTIGIWNGSASFTELNRFSLDNSDVITFHNYNPLKNVKEEVDSLEKQGRPIICSEYMARPRGSTFESILPYFEKKNIGAINWGFVSGKTQTIYPWNYPRGSSKKYYNKWENKVRSVYPWQSHLTAPEPNVWFHDVFRADGTPYDSSEIKLIKKLVHKSKQK